MIRTSSDSSFNWYEGLFLLVLILNLNNIIITINIIVIVIIIIIIIMLLCIIMFWLLLLPSFYLLGESQQTTKGRQNTLVFTFPIFCQYSCSSLFCITPRLHVMPSFPIHLSNSAETLPRAPITTGTISAFLNFHNLLISFFKSWYFYSFSLSFSSTLTSAGTAISIIIPVCSFLSIIIRSGRLASIRLSH